MGGGATRSIVAEPPVSIAQPSCRGRLVGEPTIPRVSVLIAAFLCAAVSTLLLARWSRQFNVFADHDLSGPQKLHAEPVPRVGGLGILVGVVAGSAVVAQQSSVSAPWLGMVLVACGMPAFAMGLLEDLTQRVGVRQRLVATAVAAALAYFALDVAIRHTAIPGLDWVASHTLGAAALTIFTVAGVANAVNIIDGANGLASMCMVIILIALAYVAFQVGDTSIALLALAGAGATLGFFMWNFPAGLVFLGDGGAYFLGFFVAELSILLLQRNSEVSPMFPLLACIYPVVETLFSIYRRRVLRDISPGLPDGIHLHSLVYRRLVRWGVGRPGAKALTRRNSMTSPYLWALCMMSVVPAVLWWDDTAVLAAFIVLFVCSYVALYWRIVRFKSPRWLVSRQ